MFTCSLLLISATFCAQKKEAIPAKKEITITSQNLVALDLTSAGINATIQVPEGVKIIPNEYEILIGNGKDILIKIEEAYETMDQKIEFVKNNDIRGFKQFVKQNSTCFIAEMDPMGMGPEFDFTYISAIGEKIYFLQDQGSERHKELKIVETMLAISQTIKTN
jgi:hypothetical protein